MSEDTTQVDTSAEEVQEEDTSFQDSSEDTSEGAGKTPAKVTPTEETQEEDTEETTEKGTKKDPNPLSAVHQELANERRARLELESKLRDLEKPKDQPQTPKQYVDASKLNTKEELAAVLNFAFKTMEEQNNRFKEFGGQFQNSQEKQADYLNYQNFASEAQEVYKKFPELNEESADYNAALDAKLARIYQKSAYDATGKLLRNRPSFAEIASEFMEAVKSGRAAGAEQANIRTIQKQTGKTLKTTKKSSTQDFSNLSTEEMIAKQMGL